MNTSEFDKLLASQSLAQLRAQLASTGAPASPNQAQRLSAHARTFTATPQPLRLGIVHTYTSELLDPWLDLAGSLQGLDVQTYHAPYGLALQEAVPGSGLLRHEPTITLLLLQREDLHPALARPIASLDVDGQAQVQVEAMQRLQQIVQQFRDQPVGQLVVTLLPSTAGPALGLFDAQSELSEAAWWGRFKAELAAWVRQNTASTLFMDLDEVMLQVGRSQFLDRRFWYSARFPFAAPAAFEFTRRLVALAVVMTTPKAKVLVLDADNTLWGGVIGEDGIDGIALGPDYPGSLYVEFQRRILGLQQRGFVLAMCSKNNPADVDQVLQKHPHQVLREEHFAARRVNWTTKPENLRSLAEELNLGLDAFIFVDDSDHECAAVRHALPQVEVVQVPSRAVDVPSCLDQVARLEVLFMTREDMQKTAMYAQERRRRELIADTAGQAQGGMDYLRRLDMRMRIQLDPKSHVPRLSQLTQKTNQFNLTTRRYDEQRVQDMLQSDAWLVADFSLADAFGDSGIVGLAVFEWRAPDVVRLDTFLMSCRVIGREAEFAFLQALLRLLSARGVHAVDAEYLPTAKNVLVKDFLPSQGFLQDSQGFWRLDLRRTPARAAEDFPIAITLDPPSDA